MGLLANWINGPQYNGLMSALFGSPIANGINVTPSLMSAPNAQAAQSQYNANNAAGMYDPNQNGGPYTGGLMGPQGADAGAAFAAAGPQKIDSLRALFDLSTNPAAKAELTGKQLANTITALGIPRAQLTSSIYRGLQSGSVPSGIPPILIQQALGINPTPYETSKFYESLQTPGSPAATQAGEASAKEAGLTVTPDIRSGGTQLILDPTANNGRGGYVPAYKNPNVPEGYTVQEGQDGQQQIVPVPGGPQGVSDIAQRQAAGRASGEFPYEVAKEQFMPRVLNPNEYLTSARPLSSLNGLFSGPGGNLPPLPPPPANGIVPSGPPSVSAPQAQTPVAQRPQPQGNNQLPPVAGMSPQQFKVAETQLPEQYKEVQDAGSASRDALQQLQQLSDEYHKLPPNGFLAPGAGAGTRGAFAKAINTTLTGIGMGPLFDPNQVAGIEAANKTTFRLGAQLSRFMGSREAAQIVEQAVAANPGIMNTPKGFDLVTRSLQAAAQRQVDRSAYFTKWLQQHRDTSGADIGFNTERPVGAYAKSALIPNVYIDALKKNQNKAPDFDAKFGPGMSNIILGATP